MPPMNHTFQSNISVGGGLALADLRLAASNDPRGFYTRLLEPMTDPATGKPVGLIPRGALTWKDVRDLKALFRALADVKVPVQVDVMGETRTIDSSAFPLLVGGLTQQLIEARYQAVPTIGGQLVEDFRDSKKVTTLGSVHAMDKKVQRVDEEKEFPEISASEEKYEIRSNRNGRKFSITAEAIEENDVAGIVQRLNALAYIAANWVEKQTLQRVCDLDGSAASPAEPYVMHRNGAAASIYSSTANTPGPRAPRGTRILNNALVDEEDLEAARSVLAGMKDQLGERISIPMSQCILLVPDALVGIANKIRNSELVPGEENALNAWGPRGSYQPRVLSSPKLDDISTTAWYLGMFAEQFKRKWKLDFEYVTLAGDTQAFLDKRIAFQARIAWDCEIGATDYVYVVQSLSGSTAPARS